MNYWQTFYRVLKFQRWPIIDPEELAEQERQERINKLTGNKKTPRNNQGILKCVTKL